MPLSVDDLHVEVEGKEMLRGVTLRAERGEAVILMGPNDSGKTTLAYTVMGHPRYKVTKGSIELVGVGLTGLPAYERALKEGYESFLKEVS
ncbi:MAG: ATP-binding cassette domain-containing protein [Acidilobus sp.]